MNNNGKKAGDTILSHNERLIMHFQKRRFGNQKQRNQSLKTSFRFKGNIKNPAMVKTIEKGIKYSCPTVSLNIAFGYFLYHPSELLFFDKVIK